MEPLAEIIWSNTSVTGIQTKEEIHKISLYADDVLLFLSNPTSSVPANN